MVIETLQSLRKQECYDLFRLKVNKEADTLGVEEPQLPRQRKIPARYEDGLARCHTHANPKSLYQQFYYEALDNAISCLKDRFNQPGYNVYCNLENILIKASIQEDFKEPLKAVFDLYKDDIEPVISTAQLLTFGVTFKYDKTCSSIPTISDIISHFKSLSVTQAILLCQVSRILQLLMIMPATNASSERSFSALRRVKTYLRSTMHGATEA